MSEQAVGKLSVLPENRHIHLIGEADRLVVRILEGVHISQASGVCATEGWVVSNSGNRSGISKGNVLLKQFVQQIVLEQLLMVRERFQAVLIRCILFVSATQKIFTLDLFSRQQDLWNVLSSFIGL